MVLAICWRLSALKSPSHEKSIFLKIRSFFSFKFFQGHNWLTNYPDSEFHGHWKTVTLSSISPNLSKHWRFLAFWLSLCFGSFLLFLVCHDTAFLFSTRAMTALDWLPNANRDMIILVRWDRRSRYTNRFNSRFLINSRASCAFCKKIKKCDTISSPWTSSLARITFNTPAIFFLEFLILGMKYTLSWLETLRDGNPSIFSY